MKRKLLERVILFFLFLQFQHSYAVTYVVNGTGWANAGAGNTGDLLYCLTQANSTAGGPHSITFTGLAGTPAVITMTSAFTLNSANANGLFIDGQTKPGWVCGTPNVVIQGGWGLNLNLTNVSNVIIRALIFREVGIAITGGGSNRVFGCWFNLNNAGTAVQGVSGNNGATVFSISGSTNNVIGSNTCNNRNVITLGLSPYSWTALLDVATSNGTRIAGNYIGTDRNGTTAFPAPSSGVSNIRVNGSLSVTIDSNVIAGADLDGIRISGGTCNNLTISNNMIGVSALGTGTTFGNTAGGINAMTGATLNTCQIINNTISRNRGTAQTRGIRWEANSTSLLINNNKIGTNSTGLYDGTDYGNQNGGIVFSAGTLSNVTITNNTLCRNGWTTVDNNACGIYIATPVATLNISNNRAGVYDDYSIAGHSGNGWSGIWVNSASTAVTITNNVVGDNGDALAQKSHGIAFSGSPSNITVYGNYVGVSPNSTDIGNWANGIELNPASNVTIGGTGGGQRNFIGFNKGRNSSAGFPRAGGIALIAASNVTIRNNYIGVAPNGTAAGHANAGGGFSANHGIFSEGATNHIYIGGTSGGQGNVIANSGTNGIHIFAGSYMQMRDNSIYCNGARGIFITAGQNNGITPPAIDVPNTAPNVPNQVRGTVAGANQIVEIFTTNACTPTCNLNPQGQGLLTTLTAAGTNFNYVHGSTIFNFISATATTAGCLTSTLASDNCSTSEFSTCVTNTLPVDLLSFAGRRTGQAIVSLLWQTSSEKGHAYFELERSLNGKDFQFVERLYGQGDDHSGASYAYTDYQAGAEGVYYRLKMVDGNGEFSYSTIIAIGSENTGMHIYPNPAKDNINLEFWNENSQDALEVSIYTTQGQEVQTNTYSFSQRLQTQLNVQDLPAGVYYISIKNANAYYLEKLMVE